MNTGAAASQMNSAVALGFATTGVSADVMDPMIGAYSAGSNGRIYTSGWTGNQYVSTIKLGTGLKIVSAATLVIGIGIDAIKVSEGSMHPAVAGIDVGVGVYGVAVGGLGLPVTLVYFGVDSFYPGGWPGALNDQGALLQANRAVLGPSFTMYKDWGSGM